MHNLDITFSSQSQERNFKVFLEMKGEIREQVVHPVSSCLSSEVFPVGGWDYLELIMASNIKLWGPFTMGKYKTGTEDRKPFLEGAGSAQS